MTTQKITGLHPIRDCSRSPRTYTRRHCNRCRRVHSPTCAWFTASATV